MVKHIRKQFADEQVPPELEEHTVSEDSSEDVDGSESSGSVSENEAEASHIKSEDVHESQARSELATPQNVSLPFSAVDREDESVGLDLPAINLSEFPPELLALVQSELPVYDRLVRDLERRCTDVQTKTPSLINKLSSTDTSHSLSILDIKLHTHLSYVSHLLLYALIRINGLPLSTDPALDRLLELKTVLEKIRPLENRLAYQIQKLSRRAENKGQNVEPQAGADIARDPLRFGPNPKALTGDESSSEDDIEESAAGSRTRKTKSLADNVEDSITADKSSTLYRPPRFAPTLLDGSSKRERGRTDGTGRGASHQAARSRILRDLKSQFSDMPEDMPVDGTGWGSRDAADMTEAERFIKEKDAFEEEHFVRLPISKKERKARKELANMSGVLRARDELETLDDFSSLSRLDSRVRRLDAMTHGTGALARSKKRALAAAENDVGSNKRARTMAGEELVAEAGKMGRTVGKDLTRAKRKFEKVLKKKNRRDAKKLKSGSSTIR
ncbi:hypothetical protein HDU93_000590 [Gonapodya sp. JEL0774]|nr:hypothetical protein HDU93_000590 [Gonapodya sp. JEL0774]